MFTDLIFSDKKNDDREASRSDVHFVHEPPPNTDDVIIRSQDQDSSLRKDRRKPNAEREEVYERRTEHEERNEVDDHSTGFPETLGTFRSSILLLSISIKFKNLLIYSA